MSYEQMFKKLEEDELLLDQMSSLGWAFWPMNKDGKYTGFLDEGALRALADEIERRNKPFWDEYERYCEEQEKCQDQNATMGEDSLDFTEFAVVPLADSSSKSK